MKEQKPEAALAGETIRQAARDQVLAGDPPETQRTYARLQAMGMSEEQAIEHIAAVLTSEIFSLLKHKRPYDRDRYEAALRALPTLPWETGEAPAPEKP